VQTDLRPVAQPETDPDARPAVEAVVEVAMIDNGSGKQSPMNKLEVIFRLGLAHPLLILDTTERRAWCRFSETKNETWIEVQRGLLPEKASGEFDVILLHVERECGPEDRDEARYYAVLNEWGIIKDAATALWRFMEYVREGDFMTDQTVAGYPVVPSETPQDNPVVQTARAEVVFDGQVLTTLPFTTVPAIQIRAGAWDRVCEKLEKGEDIPPYRSFLLDAYYFATSGDPIRAVVMGSAAWETGLKQYLTSIGKNVLKKNRPTLTQMAEDAKRDHIPASITGALANLARLRNDLLHEGKKSLTKEDIVGMILAVDEAIIWLYS
jgi:hypothetical protein